jgi:ATP-dependent RNA helicase SUPV3L1/SUV3
MNDGTFGVTADADEIDDETVNRVESHRYDPVRVLQWRNSELAFRSVDALIECLDAPPPARGLARARPATDLMVLRQLSARDDVKKSISAPAAVRQLWEVCQLPDFRKLSIDEHVHLVEAIHSHLAGPEGVLPDDWIARQIARLDHADGDVATLTGRLSHIRTWTYVTHRPGWVRESAHWQGVSKAVEDRISDALHERLTQRFVDRRTSVLMRKLREDDELGLSVDESGGVAIDGEVVGKLDGFRFAPDPHAEGVHGRTLRAATLRGLEGELFARVRRLSAAADTEITLSEHGKLWWDGAIVGRLVAGSTPLAPNVVPAVDNHLGKEDQESVLRRLTEWTQLRINSRIAPLLALREAADARAGRDDALPSYSRGIAYQLCESFGSLDRERVSLPTDLRTLIRSLTRYGVWFGRRTIFLPKLLRPEAASMLALLWGLWSKREKLIAPPPPGITSFEIDPMHDKGFLAAAGFKVVGSRAIRFDMVERIEEELEEGALKGATAEDLMPRFVSYLGCSNEVIEGVLRGLGWQIFDVVSPTTGTARVLRMEKDVASRRSRKSRKSDLPASTKTGSPFASLAKLMTAR